MCWSQQSILYYVCVAVFFVFFFVRLFVCFVCLSAYFFTFLSLLPRSLFRPFFFVNFSPALFFLQAYLDMVIMGIRNMQPYQYLPMQLAYCVFEVRAL